MRLFPGKKKRGHASAKNTCLRLYLDWLEHNQISKINGPAPVQWMKDQLSHTAGPPAAIFRNSACVNHAPQCVSPLPASRRWSLARIRTRPRNYAPCDWLAPVYCESVNTGQIFTVALGESAVALFFTTRPHQFDVLKLETFGRKHELITKLI